MRESKNKETKNNDRKYWFKLMNGFVLLTINSNIIKLNLHKTFFVLDLNQQNISFHKYI